MVEENNKNFLFILSGPSGTGKTTLCQYLLKEYNNLSLSISATTRNPRYNEKNGKDYYFISKNNFEEKIKNNEFLEYAKVFDNYYGTPKIYVEEKINNNINVLFDIDWQGMRKIKQSAKFNIKTIFLIPPSIQELKNRLIKRGDSDEQVKKRIAGFQNDAEKADEYDYIVINDDFDKTLNLIKKIYETESLKLSKQENLEFIKNYLMKVM